MKGTQRDPGSRRPYRRTIVLLGLTIPALLAVFAALLYYTLPEEVGEQASLQELRTWTEDGEVTSAVLLSVDHRVVFVRDGERHRVALPDSDLYAATFLESAIDANVPVEVDQQVLKRLVQPVTLLIPALVLAAAFVLIFLLMRSGGSNAFLKAAARRGSEQRPVTFADVAGADEAITEIREVRDYLKDPSRLEDIGAEAPRGVLLVGPPGTGKTLLARAVAGEADVPFFSMSGTDFVEMYVGVGAARVRDLFRQVRERAPAILFIDELDALGRARGGASTASTDERDQTLNQLLVEIDGFATTSGVVIIGATNRPDVLDPALLRRGRFDRRIVVDRPDRHGRLAILRVHAGRKRFEGTVDLERIAAQTTGFTGADLASLTNEAALLAARRGKAAIGPVEVEQAIDRVLGGTEGRARRLSPREKRAVAHHEAGHATVAFTSPAGNPVSRISIVSRGEALGFTRIESEDDRALVSRSELELELTIAMAGRAAESLVLGEPSTSAVSDLRRATDLARRMVCQLGMSEALGQVALGRPGSSPYLDDGSLVPDYSAEVAGLVDREIRRLVDTAFERARDLLDRHRGVLAELAAELVERETLREPELERFVTAVRTGAPPAPASDPASRAASTPPRSPLDV